MSHRKCLNCGSSKIFRDARIIDKSYYEVTKLEMAVDNKPNAIFFKGTNKAKINCDVCEECGHIMLRVSPLTLKSIKPSI